MAEPAPEQRSQQRSGEPAWPLLTRSPDAAIDSVLSGLRALPTVPVAGHLEIYRGVHDRLLAELNSDAE